MMVMCSLGDMVEKAEATYCSFWHPVRRIASIIWLNLLAFGALGHGGNQDRHIPTPVETLRNLPPTISVSAGSFFTNALNGKLISRRIKYLNKLAQHDLYSWGRGEYAVFGDGNNKNLKAPVRNESLLRMKETEGILFKRIKSCASQTLGLTGTFVLTTID